jgi:hypothetical protein
VAPSQRFRLRPSRRGTAAVFDIISPLEAQCRAMRALRFAVLVALVVCGAFVVTAAVTHSHDRSGEGFYDAHCPSCELGRQTVGALLSPPAVMPFTAMVFLEVVSARTDRADVLLVPASPRSPPTSSSRPISA